MARKIKTTPVVRDKDGNILYIDEGDEGTLDTVLEAMERTPEEDAEFEKSLYG